jgi:hypothetical protein
MGYTSQAKSRSAVRCVGYIGIWLASTLGACRLTPSGDTDVSIDDKSHPTMRVREQGAAHFSALYKRIKPNLPGRGVTDYPGNTEEDIPKSYAMVLLAELDRRSLPVESEWPDLGIAAGFWLLKNSDANNNGLKGWGVPVAWDAYGDGSVNEASTEYTISTALVIHALLDWMQRDPGSPRSEILKTVEAAIEPYLKSSVRSPGGLFPYSLREVDYGYDTFNPAAYLAGQVQRFSCIVSDDKQRKKMRDAADLTMAALLKERRISKDTGAWFWNYSVQEDSPNDLPHASYIAEGISTYCRNGGRLTEEFKLPLIFEHLNEFIPEDHSKPVRGWPRFWQSVDRPARSYDVGMAIYVSGNNPRLRLFREQLVNSVGQFRKDGMYLRYPVGTKGLGELCVQEYESYLYAGLARYLVDELPSEQRGLKAKAFSTHLPRDTFKAGKLSSVQDGYTRVPFVEWKLAETKAHSEFDSLSRMSRVVFSNGPLMEFNDRGIPVWLAVDPVGDITAVFREIPSGVISIMRFGASSRKQQFSALLPRISEAALIFRAAHWHKHKLYLVVYDNIKAKNFLIILSLASGGYVLEREPVQLPRLEDPAGATYEMIPSVYFAALKDELWLFAGTLKSLVSAEAPTEERIPNCLRVLEVAETPDGPVALCQDRRPYPANPYFLYSMSQLPVAPIPSDCVPWNLRFDDGRVKINKISNDSDWAEMFAFDLRRAQQSGWMEFGINNTEGRIPWSQIYYLNGFLDILFLTRGNVPFFNIFGDLVLDIRRRLELEVILLNRVWVDGNYFTKAFTVDRSAALFAVQTSRLLLLFDRYLAELDNQSGLSAYESVRSAVFSLKGSIDQLAKSGESTNWIGNGIARLQWPKGCKFYFDGTSVPFNHQNEWAYSVHRSLENKENPFKGDEGYESLVAAGQIIDFFLEKSSNEGEFPRSGVWDYWWGKAYDGWTESDGVSLNNAAYKGDKIKAWISFRTIDAMAAISSVDSKSPLTRNRIVSSVSNLLYHGRLYPFAAYEALRLGEMPRMRRDVAIRYARIGSPWEAQSASYAIFFLTGSAEKNDRPQ